MAEAALDGGEGDVGYGWLKASIAIEAREDAAWSARAVLAADAPTPAAAFEFAAAP